MKTAAGDMFMEIWKASASDVVAAGCAGTLD